MLLLLAQVQILISQISDKDKPLDYLLGSKVHTWAGSTDEKSLKCSEKLRLLGGFLRWGRFCQLFALSPENFFICLCVCVCVCVCVSVSRGVGAHSWACLCDSHIPQTQGEVMMSIFLQSCGTSLFTYQTCSGETEWLTQWALPGLSVHHSRPPAHRSSSVQAPKWTLNHAATVTEHPSMEFFII